MLNKPHASIAKNLEDTLRYLSMSKDVAALREYARNVLFYLCGQARAASYEGWISETVERVLNEDARVVTEDGTQLKTTADYLYEGMDAAQVNESEAALETVGFTIAFNDETNASVMPQLQQWADAVAQSQPTEETQQEPLQQVEVTIPDAPLTLRELPKSSRIDAYIGLLAAVWPSMPDVLPHDEAEQWIEEQIERNMQAVSATVTRREFETSDQTTKDGATYDVIVQWRDDGPIDEFVFNSRHSGIPVLTKKRAWQTALETEFAAWEQSATQDFIDYLKQHDGHGAAMAQPLAQYVKKRLQDTFDYKRICGEHTIPSYQVEIGQGSSHTFVDYTISIIVVEHNQPANQHLSFAMNVGEAYVAMPVIYIPGHHHGLRRAGSPDADKRLHEFVAKMSHKKTVVETPKLFDKGFKRNRFGILATVDGVSHALESSAVRVDGNRLYLTHLLTTDAYKVTLIDAITVIMFDDDNAPRVSFLYDVLFDEEVPIGLNLSDENFFGVVDDAYQITAFEINSCRTINPAAEDDAAA